MSDSIEFIIATRREHRDRIPNAYDALKQTAAFKDLEDVRCSERGRVIASGSEETFEAVKSGLGPNYIVERDIPHHML